MPASDAPTRYPHLLVLGGLLLVVFIPILFYSCPQELSRWRAAQAMERHLDGDLDFAIAEMEELTEAYPENLTYRIRLAQWLLQDQQPTRALAIAESLVERYPDHGGFGYLYVECLQASGKPREALAVYKKHSSGLEFPSSIWDRYIIPEAKLMHLNNLSYMRALASSEISEAQKDMQTVVGAYDHDWNNNQPLQLSTHIQLTLCTAVLNRHALEIRTWQTPPSDDATSLFEAALDHLDREIRFHSKWYQDKLSDTQTLIVEGMSQHFPMRGQSERKVRKNRNSMEGVAFQLAVLLTARAHLYQVWPDGEYEDRMVRDQRAVQQLGFDANRIVRCFPAIWQAEDHAESVARILDTRGCLLLWNSEPKHRRRALDDLTVAVDALEALVAVGPNLPSANNELTADRRQQHVWQQRTIKTLATVLYHRVWAYNSLELHEAAHRDGKRIRQLGFAPGPGLF